jgi:hypothetical protein
MPILATLTLTDQEKHQLAAILGCDLARLDDVLAAYASAALDEYVRMFLGQRVFTRGSDILEYRLLVLTKRAFAGQLPDEQRVSALFQKSATGSRSLIRATLAKFQYELTTELATTMGDVLGRVEPDGDGWKVVITSEALVEAMNRQLGFLDGTLPQITKRPSTVSSYHIQPSAYGRLCHQLGIAVKAHPA